MQLRQKHSNLICDIVFLCQDGGHSEGVNCVQWHPDDSLLYSGSDDTNIVEWDLQTGKTKRCVYFRVIQSFD